MLVFLQFLIRSCSLFAVDLLSHVSWLPVSNMACSKYFADDAFFRLLAAGIHAVISRAFLTCIVWLATVTGAVAVDGLLRAPPVTIDGWSGSEVSIARRDLGTS